jgi:hypothetical protein
MGSVEDEEGGNFYTFQLEHPVGEDLLDDVVVDVTTTVN